MSGRRLLGAAVLASILGLTGSLATASATLTSLTARSTAEAKVAVSGAIRPRAARPPAVAHEVYGYLPYWELNRASARTIDYGSLSTIAFFAIRVTGSGALDRKTPGYQAYVSSAAAAVTNAAHQRGVRVVPTFQLFDSGRLSTLRRLLGSRRAQDAFINQALALMAQRRADGANIDFEPVPSSLAPAFASLVGRFSRALHARLRGAQLVVATPAIFSPLLVSRLAPVVDRLFVMAYDYHGPGSSAPGSVAPLRRGPHNVAKTIAAYTLFISPAKLILGMAYYGYSWPIAQNRGVVSVRTAGRYGGVHGVTYDNVMGFLRRHPTLHPWRDPTGGASFRWWDARNHVTREVHLEDALAVRQKVDLAIAEGLAGVGVWTLSGVGGAKPMTQTLRGTLVTASHRVIVAARARPAALVGRSIVVQYTIGITNSGNVPERGSVTWRVLTPRGRTLASGTRLVVLYENRTASFAFTSRLGPSTLGSGTYRIDVQFLSVGHRWGTATRFSQRD